MSRVEPKAGEWLRQQIEELGALRTASVRDPQFKAWRQNTLTFIQRIWPGEQPRSERFRRIPFSPPSTRADARAIREQFERGCGEALEYLNTLLAAVGEEPVKPGTVRTVPRADGAGNAGPIESEPSDAASDVPSLESLEGVIGDGPLLDLPDPAAPPLERSSGPTPLPANARGPLVPDGLPDDYAGATPLDGPTASVPESKPVEASRPAEPAPPPPAEAPTTKVSVRSNGGTHRAPGSNPLKGILDPHRKSAAEARLGKSGKGKKGGKRRLKDMLGLDQLGSRPAPVRPETPSPIRPVPPIPPVAASEARPDEPRMPEAPRHEERPAAPARSDATPSGLGDPDRWSMPERPAAPPEEEAGDSLLPLTAEDVEPSHHDEEAPASRAPHANRADEGPDPFDPSTEADEHAGDAARATAEFLRNSPVLSSAPRPVTRRVPAGTAAHAEPIPSRGSAASQMLAIASEVDSLGVPEGHRARARAALMDLARQLDEPEISWDVLREAVQFVMEFPPIARRALPLLLPFLDLAA